MDLNKNGKDDIAEIRDGVVSFIQQEATLVSGAVSSSVIWLQGILAGVPDAVQTHLTGVIKEVDSEGGDLGTKVTNTLNLLYNDAKLLERGIEQSVIDGAKAIKSEAIQAIVALTTAVPGK